MDKILLQIPLSELPKILYMDSLRFRHPLIEFVQVIVLKVSRFSSRCLSLYRTTRWIAPALKDYELLTRLSTSQLGFRRRYDVSTLLAHYNWRCYRVTMTWHDSPRKDGRIKEEVKFTIFLPGLLRSYLILRTGLEIQSNVAALLLLDPQSVATVQWLEKKCCVIRDMFRTWYTASKQKGL